MPSILAALVAVLCALPAFAAEQAPAPKEMVLLTVSGLVGKTNRGPLDPKQGQPAGVAEDRFPRAFAFDRATLLGAAAQGTVTAKTKEFEKPCHL